MEETFNEDEQEPFVEMSARSKVVLMWSERDEWILKDELDLAASFCFEIRKCLFQQMQADIY